jgi:hypothetical protein
VARIGPVIRGLLTRRYHGSAGGLRAGLADLLM